MNEMSVTGPIDVVSSHTVYLSTPANRCILSKARLYCVLNLGGASHLETMFHKRDLHLYIQSDYAFA